MASQQATIRLDYRYFSTQIITSVYISLLVLLTFIMTGLFIHRDAKDERLKTVTNHNTNKKKKYNSNSKLQNCRNQNPFFIHLFGCIVLAFSGLISIYIRDPILHAFNAFVLLVMVIFFNHLGCSKYKYECCITICCRTESTIFKIFFDNNFKVNIILSCILLTISITWWVIYPNIIQDDKSIFAQDITDNTAEIWNKNYMFFLIIMTSFTLLHLSIASIYSRISLGVFCVLLSLFLIVIVSADEHLLIYWFVFLFGLISSISFFSCSEHLKLRLISISLVGG
eukprot:527539_1